MDMHMQIITGIMSGWGLGIHYEGDSICFDFIRWYFIIAWHRG
jgi:hypothetical protein